MRIPVTFAGVARTVVVVSMLAPSAFPQGAPPRGDASAANVIVPQARPHIIPAQPQPVRVAGVAADVTIVERIATTSLEVTLENPSGRPQEAELVIPVPDGAVVRSFGYDGAGPEPTARLLPRDEARTTYREIVGRQRDPALLEFAGYNLVRSSVFPVPAQGRERVRLVYENVLASDGDRVDYVLPRSESFESASVPWSVSVHIDSKRPVSTVYSPSHEISSERRAPGRLDVRAAAGPEAGRMAPGPFRLSYLAEGAGVTASLMAYPDPSVGGDYFLLLAGLPAVPPTDRPPVRREVTLVVDRSGSMAGAKIEQVRAAALQVLQGLEPGESFNVVDYSDSVATFSERPVAKNGATEADAREYVGRLRDGGGTNIRDALVEALRQRPDPGVLPLVLFLTDGLPTVGETREAAIRKAVADANEHKKRIFTFGVGYDVNAPLLSGIAATTRAATTFVLPDENVEAKVSQVFRRLAGPVLAAPRLAVLDASGAVTTRAARETLPSDLPDLFEGDQLVLLGQYQGPGTLTFRLSGDYFGQAKDFSFSFDPSRATVRNAFVPRLWASRKIAVLIDAIQQAGADGAALPPARMKELVDEIVRLSIQFGILTEYTSFLATDGAPIASREAATTAASEQLRERSADRSGAAGVNQSMNTATLATNSALNRSNTFYDRDMRRVETNAVQQIDDRTFFKRNGRWVDARLVGREATVKPDEVVVFGTPQFDRVVDRLVTEGRQGILALGADTLVVIDGRNVLLKVGGSR
jgi:Ca-activated chloride channel homolog